MARRGSSAVELELCRQALIVRAALERHAMRETTEELQEAGDRVAHVAIAVIRIVRRYWLPAGMLFGSMFFKRARPVLRAAQTGLAVWQTMRMLRNAPR